MSRKYTKLDDIEFEDTHFMMPRKVWSALVYHGGADFYCKQIFKMSYKAYIQKRQSEGKTTQLAPITKYQVGEYIETNKKQFYEYMCTMRGSSAYGIPHVNEKLPWEAVDDLDTLYDERYDDF